MSESKKLCVKCVRDQIATMRKQIEEIEQRADRVEEMLAQLITDYVESTMGQ